MLVDFDEITEMVNWTLMQPDPEQALMELAMLFRAENGDMLAELDAAFYDNDEPPEEF